MVLMRSPALAGAPAKRPGGQRGGAAVLVALCLGVLAGWIPGVPVFLGFSICRSPAAAAAASSRRPWLSRGGLSLAAEGEVAVAPEGDVTVAAEGAGDQPELESGGAPAAPPQITAPLFQELNISSASTAKGLMRAIVGAFNKGERAVDLIATDPRYKHTFLYSIGLLPEAFRASAQILVRRRDRRLRMRVAQQLRPQEDENPEVLRIATGTNATRLGEKLKYVFVDPIGTNVNRTVQLQFAGARCAEIAILAMEYAGRTAYRELVFRARYVEEYLSVPAATGPGDDQDAPAAPPTKRVSILVTLTAA